MSGQNQPSQYLSTKKSSLTPAELEAAENATRASAGLDFSKPSAPDPASWPSSIAQTLQHKQMSGKQVPTSPLPAPQPKKGRPTPLDLRHWEWFKPEIVTSTAGKRRRSTPERETTDEAADHETSDKHRSFRPAPITVAPQSEKKTRRNDSKEMESGSEKKTSGPSAR
ncbi:MAG: hypothetical protein Q9161_003294 [Pseudevernia consocians]